MPYLHSSQEMATKKNIFVERKLSAASATLETLQDTFSKLSTQFSQVQTQFTETMNIFKSAMEAKGEEREGASFLSEEGDVESIISSSLILVSAMESKGEEWEGASFFF